MDFGKCFILHLSRTNSRIPTSSCCLSRERVMPHSRPVFFLSQPRFWYRVIKCLVIKRSLRLSEQRSLMKTFQITGNNHCVLFPIGHIYHPEYQRPILGITFKKESDELEQVQRSKIRIILAQWKLNPKKRRGLDFFSPEGMLRRGYDSFLQRPKIGISKIRMCHLSSHDKSTGRYRKPKLAWSSKEVCVGWKPSCWRWFKD